MKGLLPQNRDINAPTEGETWNLTPDEAEGAAPQKTREEFDRLHKEGVDKMLNGIRNSK